MNFGRLTKEEQYNDYLYDNHERNHVFRHHWECKYCAMAKEKADDEAARDRPAGPVTSMRRARNER